MSPQKLSVTLQHVTDFDLVWEPLQNQQVWCYVWEYPAAKKTDQNLPVVYRHVLQIPQVGIVTIYVGEGSSLRGPDKYNLRYQYSNGGHGTTRVKVRDYVAGRSEKGWTEILSLKKPIVNLIDDRERKFLQMTFIVAYYWEHQRLLAQGHTIPEFLNDPR